MKLGARSLSLSVDFCLVLWFLSWSEDMQIRFIGISTFFLVFKEEGQITRFEQPYMEAQSHTNQTLMQAKQHSPRELHYLFATAQWLHSVVTLLRKHTPRITLGYVWLPADFHHNHIQACVIFQKKLLRISQCL